MIERPIPGQYEIIDRSFTALSDTSKPTVALTYRRLAGLGELEDGTRTTIPVDQDINVTFDAPSDTVTCEVPWITPAAGTYVLRWELTGSMVHVYTHRRQIYPDDG